MVSEQNLHLCLMIGLYLKVEHANLAVIHTNRQLQCYQNY